MNNKRIPLKQQVPFAHVQQKQQEQPQGPPQFVVEVKKNVSKSFLSNKAFVMNIKKAFQTGTLALLNFEFEEFPNEIINIETINIEGESWWQKCPLTKLDLSNNKLQVIPQYDTLQELLVLRLNNNQISQFPYDLSPQFLNLKSLSLCNNKLQEFSCQLQNLVELNISDNQLQSMDNVYLEKLELLDIQNNQFTHLPQHLPPGLKKIMAVKNKIKHIARKDFQECQLIEEIHLSKNQIEYLEDGIFNLPKLKLIDLKENRVQAFTQQILGDSHEALDQLQLSFNQIEFYTAYNGLPNLTVLLLNNNKIKELFTDIINFKQLKTLDISNNDLGDLPKEVGFLPQLVRIQLEGNPLKCIRQNIRTAGALQLKKYLQSRAEDANQIEVKVDPKLRSQVKNSFDDLLRSCLQKDDLNLSKQNLNSIPQQLFTINTLISLNLSQNQLDYIPKEIIMLQNLKRLILNENKLIILDQAIFQLPNLVELEFRSNQIQQLQGYATSAMLNLIDGSKNQLKCLPEMILSLPRLRRVVFPYNLIQSIEIIERSRNPLYFEVLDISNNQISSISDEIYYRLPNLQFLNIANNNLKTIPTILGFMNLKSIQIEGNPTKLITQQIINKGTVHILEYLQNKHPLNQRPEKLQPMEVPQIQQMVVEQDCKITPNVGQQQQSTKNMSQNMSQNTQMIVEQPNKDQLLSELKELDAEIKQCERELTENYALNKFQIQERKKHIQKLMLIRSSIYSQLN